MSTSIETEPEVLGPDGESVDEGRFIARARKFAGRLPFVRSAVAMWVALKDGETPIWAKGMIVAAVAYFMLPIDVVPDFLAGIGFTDDAAVILTTLKTISGAVKPKHFERADEILGRG